MIVSARGWEEDRLGLPSATNNSQAHSRPMSTVTKVPADRLLSDAITNYLKASKALAAASERATQSSGSTDGAARRDAYKALTELGDQVRLAQRRLTRTVQQVRRVMSPADIEALAKKLDSRDHLDSAFLLVKTALAG